MEMLTYDKPSTVFVLRVWVGEGLPLSDPPNTHHTPHTHTYTVRVTHLLSPYVGSALFYF